MFSPKSLLVSGLIFKSLIHFEFIFVYGVRKCSSFILLPIHAFTFSSFVSCSIRPEQAGRNGAGHLSDSSGQKTLEAGPLVPCSFRFKHRHLVLNHVVHGVANAADAITGGAPSGKGHPVYAECSVVIDHYS